MRIFGTRTMLTSQRTDRRLPCGNQLQPNAIFQVGLRLLVDMIMSCDQVYICV